MTVSSTRYVLEPIFTLGALGIAGLMFFVQPAGIGCLLLCGILCGSILRAMALKDSSVPTQDKKRWARTGAEPKTSHDWVTGGLTLAASILAVGARGELEVQQAAVFVATCAVAYRFCITLPVWRMR